MDSSESKTGTNAGWSKLVLLLVVVCTVLIGYWQVRDLLTFDYLAKQEGQLRALQTQYGLLMATVALLIYVAVAGLSLPGAAILTLAFGWYFGFWQALLVVSFGSTAGATVAFLLSRYLVSDWVQRRLGHRLTPIHEALEREGAFYLFSLRLIPAIPFFVINALMGLTKIRVSTFWWVSQLGMLPGTAAYVYAGSTVPTIQELADNGVGQVLSWQLLLAFVILGLLPLIVKRAIAYYKSIRSKRVASGDS